MKIAQVSPYDYTYPGGVVAHISHLKYHFARLGHEVKVIAPCTKGREPYLNESVIAMGRPLPVPSSGSIARVALSPRLVYQVEELFRHEDFDIVHVHEPFTPVLPMAAMLKSRWVNVGTFHACHSKPRGYWLTKPILSMWLPRLHGKIAVSRPALEFVSRHLPGDYCIIPNGIDVERFSNTVTPLEEFRDDKLNILFVGRLEKRKGFDCLLKAYAEVRRHFLGVRLIIVGPGTRLRHKYERMVRRYGIEDIIFAGYVPQDDLPRYYAAADVFCAPATGGESFGIVLLEAMASGKPIVATNIPGYASVMGDNMEGILVPPGDEGAVARALLRLLCDPDLRQRMGERGRVKAQDYSWELVARKVLDLYLRLLG
ncbi:MAG: glycosyltransferase family 4 protein [Chloroflexota bacterium]